MLQASSLVKEVGYSAYFGRDNPLVDRVVTFQREFQVGLQLLVVFGCQESPKCQRIDDPWVLDFIGSWEWTIPGGASEIQRTIIGERGLGLPREPVRS